MNDDTRCPVENCKEARAMSEKIDMLNKHKADKDCLKQYWKKPTVPMLALIFAIVVGLGGVAGSYVFATKTEVNKMASERKADVDRITSGQKIEISRIDAKQQVMFERSDTILIYITELKIEHAKQMNELKQLFKEEIIELKGMIKSLQKTDSHEN